MYFFILRYNYFSSIPRMKIVVITGSIGSGKSTVAQILNEKYHMTVVDADIVVRELQQPGQSVYKKIVASFGTEILE